RACAPLAALLGDDEPVGRVLGMVKTRYFFRAAVGPGWALVGDAGHHKEFVTGLGITDALRDARSLARAIVADDATALERHWRQRDVERIETFLWGRQLGRADAVTALERLVAAHVADTPAVADRLGLVVDGHVSPFALFPPARVVPWVAAAALRGNAAPIADLGVVLADAVQARRELGRRKRLLAAVERPRTRRVEATAAARAIRRPALAEPAHFC
ncbi:MAG: hypothetical protein ABIR79_15525, partial [Candidatus Binatia bacterium]